MRPACEGTGPTGQGRRVATKAALGRGSIIGTNREIIQKMNALCSARRGVIKVRGTELLYKRAEHV